MSHKPHDLASEFAGDSQTLHDLKLGNPRFVALAARYDEINSDIYRIEAEIDHASDARVEDLKKQRLSLLDEIGALVAEQRQATA